MKPIKGARITNSADANDFMGNYYSIKVCADERLPDWRFTFADQVMVTFYFSDDTVVHKCPVSVNFQRSKDQHVSAQGADNHVVRVGFVPADMVSVMVDTVELRIPMSRIDAKWSSIKVTHFPFIGQSSRTHHLRPQTTTVSLPACCFFASVLF